MTARNFGDVEIDICPETGGIWMDGGELSDLSEWFHDGDEFAAEAVKHTGELAHDTTDAPCPRCESSKLVGYELPCVEEYAKITLDICPKCLGIWVDGPELKGVREIMMKNVAANFETKIEVAVDLPLWKRIFMPQFIGNLMGGK